MRASTMTLTREEKDTGADAPALLTRDPLKFAASDGFYSELRRRVDRYFQTTGRRMRDCPRMYLKTVILFSAFATTYALLMFGVSAWWLALPLAVILGLSIAVMGFNIQHDGSHRAYSNHGWINKFMATSMDFLGGSSYVWAKKHNTYHHSYVNITDEDDDINLGFLGRLSPHQKRLRFHRLQHFYLWVLYGFLAIKWQFYDDFRNVIAGRIGKHRLARPKGWDLVIFLAGKTFFFTLMMGLPMLLHPVWAVLLLYLAGSFAEGVALAVVFQLAHCVEQAEFPLPQVDTGRMETAWAVHQVQTTVDFARGNRVLSWFVGGLNFQIEHHLFPQICHVHYAALSRLVEQTCKEFGLRYQANKTIWAGLVSHFRWLRRMGMAGAE